MGGEPGANWARGVKTQPGAAQRKGGMAVEARSSTQGRRETPRYPGPYQRPVSVWNPLCCTSIGSPLGLCSPWQSMRPSVSMMFHLMFFTSHPRSWALGPALAWGQASRARQTCQGSIRAP